MATKVKLRQKPITGKRESLYLDFYPPIPHPETGEPTRREFLGLYIFDKPKNAIDKHHNNEVLQLAEQIKQKRENYINKPEVYSGYEKELLKLKELGEQDFVEYFKMLADKREGSSYFIWISTYHYLKTFVNGNLKFAELTETFCTKFREYLLTVKMKRDNRSILSHNSAVSYFNTLKSAIKQANKDGHLQNNLNAKIQSIKKFETQRNVLTIEELNNLAKADCQNPILKRAALFSSLTGMRFCDIINLSWDDVEHIEGQGYVIKFRQQKTKGVEVLPISDQASSLLGERKEPSNKVFEGFKYSACSSKYFYQWIGKAGITKDITFHNFRHTFATLQLSKGTDIYTVSKMLGHRDLKTTQIYAKVVDKSKQEAANRIKLDF